MSKELNEIAAGLIKLAEQLITKEPLPPKKEEQPEPPKKVVPPPEEELIAAISNLKI